MDVYLYKLKFKSPAHFGDTGIDLENVQETVSSDALFSAILNVMNIYYGSEAVTELIDKFKTSPPFLISSLFVYNGNNYFLPKPLDDSNIPSEIKKKKGKELKNMKWLSGVNLTEDDIDKMDESQKHYSEGFKREIRPRVTLDRITQQSAIYHCGYIYFKENSGLYGLAAFRDDSSIQVFQKLIELLGNTGLGGERTYGCGMFEVKFERVKGVFQDIVFNAGSKYALLSLYHPAENEQLNLKANILSYEIARKSGWITSGRDALPLKRKSVGFITEGSVFKSKPTGDIVDVTPDKAGTDALNHRIYRYGYAFTAPLITEVAS